MFDLNSLNNSALHLTKRKLPDSHEMENRRLTLDYSLHYITNTNHCTPVGLVNPNIPIYR